MGGLSSLLVSSNLYIPHDYVTLEDVCVRRVQASREIGLKFVHYVPDFPFNLLYVSKLIP